MAPYTFDDHNIRWNTLGDFEHLVYFILNIDEQNHIIDVLFKFAANQQIVLHRHLAHNNTLVIQGEHRLYEPDGTLKGNPCGPPWIERCSSCVRALASCPLPVVPGDREPPVRPTMPSLWPPVS